MRDRPVTSALPFRFKFPWESFVLSLLLPLCALPSWAGRSAGTIPRVSLIDEARPAGRAGEFLLLRHAHTRTIGFT
jgi:hypothetical protein